MLRGAVFFLYIVLETGWSAFVGDTFVTSGGDRLEEFLDEFIEMAVDPDGILPKSPSGEEEYLELFIAHSLDMPAQYADVVAAGSSYSRPDIKYSKFVRSYGELDPESGVELVRLSSATVPPEGFNVYSEDATLLCYSLSGEGEVIISGRSLRCRKYDCVWTDCSRRIQFRSAPGKPWECAFVRIHGHMRSPLYSMLCGTLSGSGLIQLTFGAGTRFRSLIWQLLSPRTESCPDPDSVYAHLLLALFLETDIALVSSSSKQVIVPDIIAAIQNYLDRNYPSGITLDALSKHFGISKYHMSREFKRYIGKSPNDYLIDIRLDHAKVLLVDSARTIAEIGQLVGIPNTNPFLYLFKSREGITPSAFRKQRI